MCLTENTIFLHWGGIRMMVSEDLSQCLLITATALFVDRYHEERGHHDGGVETSMYHVSQ